MVSCEEGTMTELDRIRQLQAQESNLDRLRDGPVSTKTWAYKALRALGGDHESVSVALDIHEQDGETAANEWVSGYTGRAFPPLTYSLPLSLPTSRVEEVGAGLMGEILRAAGAPPGWRVDLARSATESTFEVRLVSDREPADYAVATIDERMIHTGPARVVDILHMELRDLVHQMNRRIMANPIEELHLHPWPEVMRGRCPQPSSDGRPILEYVYAPISWGVGSRFATPEPWER
jgi:hypothetical protein